MSDAKSVKEKIMGLVAEYHRLAHGSGGEFVPGKSRVAYGGRVFDEREMLNLADASLEFWLTSGRWTSKFETELANFIGVRHCLFVNSGSSANLLAFAALCSPLLGDRRITRGDEVITVAAGFPTTVAPIIQHGAVPVFVDVELESANVDRALMEKAFSPRTKAVFLAHTLGNPFDAARVRKFCDERGLWLLEDNCDALGSLYGGRPTGSFGDVATSSFYPPHHITTGEGGAVFTDNPLLVKIMRSLRDWGRDCECGSGQDNKCGRRFTGRHGTLPEGYDHKYVYSHLGYNLKATDMQAAVGCAQLEKLPSFVGARRKNWSRLREAAEPFSRHFILPEPAPGAEPSWFGFLLTVRESAPFSRNDVVLHLEENGVQTRMLFAGNIVRHPCFATLREGADYRVAGGLGNTDAIMSRSFWLGVYPGLDEDRMGHMTGTLGKFMEKY